MRGGIVLNNTLTGSDENVHESGKIDVSGVCGVRSSGNSGRNPLLDFRRRLSEHR
jgi:hypothetical protein